MKKSVKQKLYGTALVACGIFVAAVTKDLTISFFVVPIGLYAIFTKKDILN